MINLYLYNKKFKYIHTIVVIEAKILTKTESHLFLKRKVCTLS